MSAGRGRQKLWLTTLLTGLLGFVLLSTLEQNIRQALQSRSRELLGGDLAVSSRRWMDDGELMRVREALAPLGNVRETEVIEFFSMISPVTGTSHGPADPRKSVTAAQKSAPQLVELVAIGDHYPLVGTLELDSSSCGRDSPDCVWGDASLALKWNLVSGSSRLQLGEASLRWGGRIERDTSRSLRGSSFAPRALLRRDRLSATGLLRRGATLTVRRLFAVEPPPSAEALARVIDRLDRELSDPGLRIQSPRDASEDEGRLLRNVADYLGLASLVGLLLAFLGCAWLLRREIAQQARNWAIFRVLSPRPALADRPFWLQSLRVSLTAAVASLLVAQLAWTTLGPRLSKALFLDQFLPTGLSLQTVLLTLVVAVSTSALALWPSLRFLKRQNLAELLKNPEILSQKSAVRPSELLLFSGFLLLISRWISHSWRVSLLFMAVLAASSALMLAVGWLSLKWLDRREPRLSRPLARWSALSLSRLKVGTLLVWLTLALASLLLALMPTLEASLRRQLEDPREAGPVPSLFLFDIQEEQLDGLRAWANEADPRGLQFLTPLIRGRLVRVNGEPFEKRGREASTREEEREARFRNRGLNLTIRDQLAPSETLYSGRLFSELPPTPPEGPEALSVERRYAERLGLELGDLLDFEIQGVPIRGRIENLRRVQWTSFQPNFFISFKSGALNDAPKTYLASLPQAPQEKRERWQADLFERFANVSTIDVSRLIETLLEGFSQISAALRLMAVLAGLSGLAAVFAVLRLRARERQSELQLLKILGASPRALAATMRLEAALLAGSASAFGLLLSLGVSATLSVVVFESPPALPGGAILLGVPLFFALCGGALGWWAARDVLSRPPHQWLRVLQEEG